jgi:hypothetical protein
LGLTKVNVGGNVLEAFSFSLKRCPDSILLFHVQLTVSELEEANLETADAG